MPLETNASRRSFLKNVAATTVAGIGGLSMLNASEAIAQAVAMKDGSGKRIFVARFLHETNTFHSIRTTKFVYPAPSAPEHHVPWKDAGEVVVPGVSAMPDGGGAVDGPACREAMDRIVESLRKALPVDGVFLQLHGGMFADGVGPAESLLVKRVREVVGPKIPIACSFDLHGNMPAWLADTGAIVVGFKTAPHIDRQETIERAAELLSEAVDGKIEPACYGIAIPMLVQGEKGMTTSEPMRSLEVEAKRVEREGIPGHAAKILNVTIFVGCPWADAPDTGMSVFVTADGSREAARAAAIHFARKIWDARRQFVFGCETAELDEGVDRALKAEVSPLFLTDSGDNVTAGAPGDSTIVLQRLIDKKAPNALVGAIYDPETVVQCFKAGEGKTIHLSIGGKIEKRCGPPIDTEAKVLHLTKDAKGQAAVVRTGGIDVILIADERDFKEPGHFQACGVDPANYKIVVVKQGYLYPKLQEITKRYVMLFTPGAADQQLEKLPYVRRQKPALPFEPDTSFEPEKQ